MTDTDDHDGLQRTVRQVLQCWHEWQVSVEAGHAYGRLYTRLAGAMDHLKKALAA